MENLQKTLFNAAGKVGREYMSEDITDDRSAVLAIEFVALYDVIRKAGLEDEYLAWHKEAEKGEKA